MSAGYKATLVTAFQKDGLPSAYLINLFFGGMACITSGLHSGGCLRPRVGGTAAPVKRRDVRPENRRQGWPDGSLGWFTVVPPAILLICPHLKKSVPCVQGCVKVGGDVMVSTTKV